MPRRRLRLRRLEPCLVLVLLLGMVPAVAQTTPAPPASTTPPTSSAAQPVLPGGPTPQSKPADSPVVEDIVRGRQQPLNVRKAVRQPRLRVRHVVRRYRSRGYGLPPVDRPTLAGVELVAPLPLPGEPPHIVVPTPAFPLEALAAGLTTPPPPIVCHHTRRDPYAPDPRLYREVPVECEPDNP